MHHPRHCGCARRAIQARDTGIGRRGQASTACSRRARDDGPDEDLPTTCRHGAAALLGCRRPFVRCSAGRSIGDRASPHAAAHLRHDRLAHAALPHSFLGHPPVWYPAARPPRRAEKNDPDHHSHLRRLMAPVWVHGGVVRRDHLERLVFRMGCQHVLGAHLEGCVPRDVSQAAMVGIPSGGSRCR